MPASPVRVAASCFVALAVVFGAGAFRLGFRADGVPGPGLLPLVTSILLLPVALRLLAKPAAAGSGEPFRRPSLVALPMLVAYGLLLPSLGFVLPTVVLLTAWGRIFHERPMARALVLAILLVVGAVGLFHRLLAVPIPLWP